MPRFFGFLPALLGGVVVLAFANVTPAQQFNQWPNPRLASIFPPGGKAGAPIEVIVQGTDIEALDGLWFSHPGIKATVVAATAPEAKDPKKVEPKKMDAKTAPSSTKFAVTIDKIVPPGLYDVRLVTGKGISNPRVFVVGDQIEILEKEPNNEVEQPQKIDLGTTVSGTIASPTDIDYFGIAAKKGQRILVHVAGASIDSRINPEIAVFDLQNRRIAYTRALPNEDALLDLTAPADGDYLIRLNQFTYTAGSADYFYRMTVWPGPWIDAVFPPVVAPGKASPVTVYGRGLPGGQADPKAKVDGAVVEKLTATVTPPADVNKLEVLGSIVPLQGTLSGFEYRLGNSNAKFLGFAQAPIVVENDSNDTAETAQKVTTPCEIVGRIDVPRDRDWFAFDAKKGDVLMIDAASQRFRAPTDLFFKLMNASKKTEIVLQDDTIDSLGVRSYYTVSRDPQPYRFVVPEDGAYQLLVSSHGNAAGPTHVYRVRISPEIPDFQLVAMPAEDNRPDSCNLGAGGVAYFNVFVQRQDGFKGDIVLTVEGLPAGVTCPTQVLGGNFKHTLLAIIATDKAPEKFDGAVKIFGTSTIDGKKTVREARPASVTWGSGVAAGTTPTITRHDRSLMVALRDKAPFSVLPKKDKLVVFAGDKGEIAFSLTRIDPEFKGTFQVQAAPGDLPTGVTIAAVTFAPGKDEQTVTVTTLPTAVAGTYNFVFRGNAKITMGKGKDITAIFPVAPVTVVVVPKQVGTLSLDKNDPSLNPGGDVTVTLKLARQNYAGELKVQLLPENTNGVTAEAVTIGPNQNDAKLTFKAAANAAPGARANLTLRAVAVIEGQTLNHDLKVNVNVTPPKK
jgi:hypothetical protein